jgi:hypothetical protein
MTGRFAAALLKHSLRERSDRLDELKAWWIRSRPSRHYRTWHGLDGWGAALLEGKRVLYSVRGRTSMEDAMAHVLQAAEQDANTTQTLRPTK